MGEGATRAGGWGGPHALGCAVRTIRLKSLNDFDEWRAAARGLLLGAVPPDEVTWLDPTTPDDLFSTTEPAPQVTERKVGAVPQRFIDWAEAGICHTDPERFALLYRLLWRLQEGFDADDGAVRPGCRAAGPARLGGARRTRTR